MLQKKELMRLAKTTARRRAAHARGLAACAPADAAVGSSSGVLTLSVNDGSAVRVYDSQTRSITEGRRSKSALFWASQKVDEDAQLRVLANSA